LSGEGEERCQEEGGAHARTIRSRILSRVKGGMAMLISFAVRPK
jgi:hypothetical protein